MKQEALDDHLDRLVGEYSDRVARGETPDRDALLAEVPAAARPGLERCLNMVDAGLAQAPSPSRPLAPGLAFGRYRLVRELGRGGMALVWLAVDDDLKRSVALKILRPGLALEARHVDRFKREGQAIAKLSHPHIVQVFEVGEENGFHYLAMEHVGGPSFATVLEALADTPRRSGDELARASGIPALSQRGWRFEQAVAALLQPVAEALACAHQAGLVHRDVKPSNILLREDGRALIADFGLAKSDGDPALSLTGDTIGTPYYMSPEQAWLSANEVDERTDVYSLGITLYEALSGRRPFDGATVLEVFEAIKTRVAPRLGGEEHASKDAAAVCRRAMARRPEDRYRNAEELALELERLAELRTTEARRAEGGPLRRAWSAVRFFYSGQPIEYRSATTFLGLPLVHAISGRRPPGQPMRVAKGWFASGEVAVGGLAFGGLACGGIAFGGVSAGIVAWGGVAAALGVAFGGVALGGMPLGGLAAGYLACGGVALGWGAMGGVARGRYAYGGNADGTYVVCGDRRDPEALQWFEESAPIVWAWMAGQLP